MKQLINKAGSKQFLVLFILSLVQVAVWAQDTTSTSTSTSVSVTKEESWYTSPWVWVIGAAVFILLLVALLGGKRNKTTAGSSDRVTVSKTVRRDSDTDV